jgi:RNA polymerase sigma factor (sigma-70 family)
MSEANPLWGVPRIHGELLKLDINISQAAVAKYMPRRRRPPSPTWRTFLANHASQIMAADFFVVPTVTYRLLFVFVILSHERRRLVHVAVTAHPTAAWTAQQLREAFPDEEAPHTTFDEAFIFRPEKSRDLVMLDEALSSLAELDPRKSRIIELRFFGGLTVEETASVLRISDRTVRREWNAARAWLYHELASRSK